MVADNTLLRRTPASHDYASVEWAHRESSVRNQLQSISGTDPARRLIVQPISLHEHSDTYLIDDQRHDPQRQIVEQRDDQGCNLRDVATTNVTCPESRLPAQCRPLKHSSSYQRYDQRDDERGMASIDNLYSEGRLPILPRSPQQSNTYHWLGTNVGRFAPTMSDNHQSELQANAMTITSDCRRSCNENVATEHSGCDKSTKRWCWLVN